MHNYRKVILDTSALIALINSEPGCEQVEEAIGNAVMNTVNIAEIAKVLVEKCNYNIAEAKNMIEELVNEIQPFDAELAYITANLVQETKKYGLSLGDRACIATSITTGYPIITADKIWKELKLDNVEIILIR